MQYTRDLNTNDPLDKVIDLNSDTSIVYAVGPRQVEKQKKKNK